LLRLFRVFNLIFPFKVKKLLNLKLNESQTNTPLAKNNPIILPISKTKFCNITIISISGKLKLKSKQTFKTKNGSKEILLTHFLFSKIATTLLIYQTRFLKLFKTLVGLF